VEQPSVLGWCIPGRLHVEMESSSAGDSICVIFFQTSVSGFATADSKFLSIVRRARMVSSGDNVVYTGSGLQEVIAYVQCVVAVFLSQVCSHYGLQAGREREFVPRSRVVVCDHVKSNPYNVCPPLPFIVTRGRAQREGKKSYGA
jgi:hypothetical protein